MIVNTETGEVLDSQPRHVYDSKRIRQAHKRRTVLSDVTLALVVYSIAATVVIAVLLQA